MIPRHSPNSFRTTFQARRCNICQAVHELPRVTIQASVWEVTSYYFFFYKQYTILGWPVIVPNNFLRRNLLRLLAFAAVNHFMWANYCHDGFVKLRSTNWPFIYMLDNCSISTTEVHHCSFHHSLVVSLLFLMYPLFNPTLSESS